MGYLPCEVPADMTIAPLPHRSKLSFVEDATPPSRHCPPLGDGDNFPIWHSTKLDAASMIFPVPSDLLSSHPAQYTICLCERSST